MGTIQELMGQTIVSITGAEKGQDEIVFTLANGRIFHMFHSQDYCEKIIVEDVCGDIGDLIGSPIVRAEAPSTENEPKPSKEYVNSWTWTFYILGTRKGTVTFRWLGMSNGCYSERVNTEWV